MLTRGKNRSVGFAWTGLLSLLLVTAGCSHRRENADIAADVQNKIRNDARMQMARVQVIATGGVVTLSGYVVNPQQRATTDEDAAHVQGVRMVIDNLQIADPTPNSSPAVIQKPSASIVRLPAEVVQSRVPAVRGSDRAAAIPQARSADRAPARPPIAVSSPPEKVTSPITAPVVVLPSSSASAGANSGAGASEPRPSASTASITPAGAPSPTQASRTVPQRNALPQPFSARAVSSPAPEPEPVTVPNGTELVVRMVESVSSDVNEKGDTFLASLSSPIMVDDQVVIPEGAGVEGKVVDVESAGRFSGRPRLAVEMTRLTYNGKIYEFRSSQYAKQGASRDVRSLAAIGGGAGVGAIIGGVLGGGRGAAIGSIIGAGAGTGAQATSKAPQVKLPAETVLSVRLQTPLTVIPAATLQRTANSKHGSPNDPFSSDDDRPVLKRRPGSPPPESDDSDATSRPVNP